MEKVFNIQRLLEKLLISGDIMANQIMNDIDRKHLELKLQTLPTRQLFVKIEILDTNNRVIEEVSGSATGGNYNIDSSASIRRTCSITFNLESGYMPSEDSVFWINKRFKLYLGLKQISNDEVYWFNKGVYAIKDPTVNISISENTITINGLDKMALHTGDISGLLETAYVADVVDENGSTVTIYVEEAVEALMKDGGETKLKISKTNLPLPHKVESSIGDTRYNVLSQFTDLFYNYQSYYDVDGYFHFEEKPTYQSDNNSIINDIAMRFSQDEISTMSNPYSLIISTNREIAYSNIKNKFIVYGGVHDDGFQPSYEIIVDDVNYPDTPYTIEKLDEKNSDGTLVCRTFVVQDDTYVDDGSEEKAINTILIPENTYQFEMAKKGDRTYVGFSQIILPSYYKVEIPSDNNYWGTTNGRQCVYYDIVWDGKSYPDRVPKKYYGNTYYVGNVWILEQILESGDYTEANDTGEPFVFWYDGKTFGIYTNNNNTEHTVYLDRDEIINHSYSIDLCKKRAEQEVYLHQQATDKVTITCIPIYSLDVNDVIEIQDNKSGAYGEYVINTISCGLGAGDTMTINANKLW